MVAEERPALLFSDIVFAWGFSVKSPFVSAAQLSILLPPPSTLIGSLAYGLAKTLKLPECELISGGRIASRTRHVVQFIRSAHFGLDKEFYGTYPIQWTDISRTLALPFLQRPYRKPREKCSWFGIHGFGKVLMPNAHARLAFVVDSNVAKKKLGEKWQQILKMAASSIISIGSKEGLVSVKSVKIKEAKIELSRAKTSYYFPRESIDYSDPSLEYLELAEFWPFDIGAPHWLNARTRSAIGPDDRSTIVAKQYILPLRKENREPVQVEVRLSSFGIAFTTDEGNPWETVVSSKSWDR